MNGVDDGEDGMSVEEVDGIDGEEELAPTDWRVREGPRNKPTQKERGEREATHVTVQRLVHSLHDGQRMHPSPRHQTRKSGDQARRPTIAIKMKSVVNAPTMPEELVTCIAVKEERHQNIRSSVALNKGVEEPWTIERVAKFIDLLNCREITLMSDTELATIAFRNRVAEMCKAEVTTEHAVNGDRTGSSRTQ